MTSINKRLPRYTNHIVNRSVAKKLGLHQGAYTKIPLINKQGKRFSKNGILLEKKYSSNPRVRYHEKAHYIWDNRLTPAQKRQWHNQVDKVNYGWFNKPGIKSRASLTTIKSTDKANGTVGEELFAKYYSHKQQKLKFRKSEQQLKKTIAKFQKR